MHFIDFYTHSDNSNVTVSSCWKVFISLLEVHALFFSLIIKQECFTMMHIWEKIRTLYSRDAISWTWLFLDAHWRLLSPIPPVGRLYFYHVFCFVILLVWDDFSFSLRSSDTDFSTFELVSCILECLFSFSFILVCLWAGGGRCWSANHFEI